MSSLVNEYNAALASVNMTQNEIAARLNEMANKQSIREIYLQKKRESAIFSEDRAKYNNYITNVDSEIKTLESEIKQLRETLKEYELNVEEYEVKLAEMYTPADNITTLPNNNAIASSESDYFPYSDANLDVSKELDTGESKKKYDNINGMANAYSGLSSASDYQKALASEESNLFKSIYHSANIFTETETDLFHNRYRYGVLNAYQTLTNSREYLFFTKPDLNIIPSGDDNSPIVNINGTTIDYSSKLHGVLQNYPYWIELCQRYPGVIESLQASLHLNGVVDPFNHLLANMVQGNLDVPGLSAELTETPSNMYGVNYTYRGSSESSDDGFDFSLEFKDTKYLPVYNFFKAYEEYETLKHHGVIAPHKSYILDKVLHDQFAIYKFVVGDDGETIIYYAKYYGVKSKSLPRDVFNANTYDNGLSYSVDFNAAFVEDMNPLILSDFNYLAYDYWKSKKNFLDVYDFRYDKVDNRAANAAIVVREGHGRQGYQVMGFGGDFHFDNIDNKGDGNPKLHAKEPGGYCYKLKWKGDASV